MTRAQRAPYRERYTIDSAHLIALVESSADPPMTPGPYGWLNWVAEEFAFPQHESAHPDSVVIRPVWEEFVLYSDANIEGTWLELGPYDVILSEPPQPQHLGIARRSVLLRSCDHLPDDPPSEQFEVETDTESYFGGDSCNRPSVTATPLTARTVRPQDGWTAVSKPQAASADPALPRACARHRGSGTTANCRTPRQRPPGRAPVRGRRCSARHTDFVLPFASSPSDLLLRYRETALARRPLYIGNLTPVLHRDRVLPAPENLETRGTCHRNATCPSTCLEPVEGH
jgi:hypothetical protein